LKVRDFLKANPTALAAWTKAVTDAQPGATRTGVKNASHPIKVADTIYVGNILTMNPSALWAEALAVGGGSILAVGSVSDVLSCKGASTRVVTLDEDNVLMPSFIDAHGHFVQTALYNQFASVASPPRGTVISIPEVITAMQRYEQNHGSIGGWLIGAFLDPVYLQEQRFPTKDDLDPSFPDVPLVLIHVSSHVVVCNSAALNKANITANTADPAGGVIVREADGKTPNGILQETAIQLLLPHLPPEITLGLPKQLEALQAQYAAWGITTAQEGAATFDEFAALAALAASWKIDLRVYPLFSDLAQFTSKDLHPGLKIGRVELSGVKLILDGSPQAKTAWLTAPYVVPPPNEPAGYSGYRQITPADLSSYLQAYYSEGWQVLAQCNGDAAIDEFLQAVTTASQTFDIKSLRSVCIHAQTARQDQIQTMSQLGVLPSFFSTHVYYWGGYYITDILGLEKAQNISPAGWALTENLSFTIHNDSPIVPADLRPTVWTSVVREMYAPPSQSLTNVLGLDQALHPQQALAAVTVNAAYQYFEEATKGTLEAGKLADMIIVGGNPLAMDVDSLKTLPILETIKEGVTIYSQAAVEERTLTPA
jgi:predicted amidohydrolase YtcJ